MILFQINTIAEITYPMMEYAVSLSSNTGKDIQFAVYTTGGKKRMVYGIQENILTCADNTMIPGSENDS